MVNLGEAVCPYYLHEKSSEVLNCELCKFRFPDAESKAQIKAYCCNFHRYQQCTLYQVLNDYYERKYEELKDETD